jgi:hypothetical protein
MSSPTGPLPPPPENFLVWVAQQPEQVRSYLLFLHQLSQLEIVVVQGGVTRRFPLIRAERNAIVQIEIE